MLKFRSAAAVVAASAAVGGALLGAGSASAHTAPTPVSTVGTPGALVVGGFDSKHVAGVSIFVQSPLAGDGSSTVFVNGRYSRLDPNRAFFTVAYGNGNCDPAQAFPVGPFTSNGKGRAVLAAGVPGPVGVSLSGSGSVSVRIGDTDKKGNATDQDGDGKTGATDVVAVPGKPSIGLVKCDKSPYDVN